MSNSPIDLETSIDLTINHLRLQLGRNSLSRIGIEFTQCTALKYLNVRNNAFGEIPQAVSRIGTLG